jgi:hypothetical protein
MESTEATKTIFEEIKESGVEISNWQSDLYFPKNPITDKIVNSHRGEYYIGMFRNNNDNELWYEIPMAYDPYWEARRKPDYMVAEKS